MITVSEQRPVRVEREIRLIPHAVTFDPADVTAAELVHTGSRDWGCTSVFLDTADQRLASLDASLAVVLAPAVPQAMAWVSYKRLTGWRGVVREARDVRCYLADARIPEVTELLSASPEPVAEASRLVDGRRLAPALILTQRREQHSFEAPSSGLLVVSVDHLRARIPARISDPADFAMVEVDVSRAVDPDAAGPVVDVLVARGMEVTTKPKYQYGLELLGRAARADRRR
jgi:hypothetical protein